MQPEMLSILRCPDDRSPLSMADQAVIDMVNARVRQGRLVNLAGKPLDSPIDGGLIRADGTRLYPVISGIPTLLADEAIDMQQLSESRA